MDGNHQRRIDQIISEGYDFKFGDYIGQGFDILKKNLGGFVLFALLFFIITVVINLIPFIGFIANTFFISPALAAGIFWVANKVQKGEATEFGDFFRGFDYVGQLAITALIQLLIVMIAMVPFILGVWDSGLIQWYMEILNDPIAAQGSIPPIPAWSFLLLAPVIYFAVAYSWAYMFVIFYKFSAWHALEASRKLITKKWFVVFAFAIVVGVIMAAGVLIVCIGILASMPAAYCMNYAAFEDVTQLNAEGAAGGDIEQHLVD